jgi:hypothetical protein
VKKIITAGLVTSVLIWIDAKLARKKSVTMEETLLFSAKIAMLLNSSKPLSIIGRNV